MNEAERAALLDELERRIQALEERNKFYRVRNHLLLGIAQFVSEELGIDILDDGDVEGFVRNLRAAISSCAERHLRGPH